MARPVARAFGHPVLDTGAVERTHMADNAVDGDVIAALGVEAGKLGLGAISTFLNVGEGNIVGYHQDINVNVVSASRDIAYTDQGDLLSCTGSRTLTTIGTIPTSTSSGWQLGMGCWVVNADAGTTTIAAGSGQTLTAPNGATLTGSGATGYLTRLGTNSWVFTVVSGTGWLGTSDYADASVTAAKLAAGVVIDRYSIAVAAASYNPVDGDTVYWGISTAFAPTASTGVRRVVVPIPGTITAAMIQSTQTVVGSAEAWALYLRLNNTTDYLIQSVASAAASRTWTNAALSIPVVAGDYLEIKSIQPTWATNPTSVGLSGTILVTAA